MIKLLKYEIMRKQKILTIALIIVAIIELAILYTIYKGGVAFGFSTLLIFLLGFGGMVFILIDTTNMYSSDLYKKQGYMLFLTPNSGFKIIASKLIIGLVELTIGFLIYFSLMFLNYKFTYAMYINELSPEVNLVLDLFVSVFEDFLPTATEIFLILSTVVLGWFVFILTVYLAITIRKTILSNIKFGGVISFIFFIIINIAITYLQYKLSDLFGIDRTILEQPVYNESRLSLFVSSFTIFSYIYNFVLSGILFFLSGYLLNKRVDL